MHICGKENDCDLPVSQILLKQAAPLLANAVVTGDALDTQKKRHGSSPPPGPTITSPSKTTSPPSTRKPNKSSTTFPPPGPQTPSAPTAGSNIGNYASPPSISTPASSPERGKSPASPATISKSAAANPSKKLGHFILSSEEGALPLARLARIGREHWSVENKNHWRRDATRWREDQSVRRKPKGAKNLALLRGAILSLIPQEKFSSLNAAFDHYIEHRAEALQLLTRTVPLQCP